MSSGCSLRLLAFPVLAHLPHLGRALRVEGLLAPGDLVLALGAHLLGDGLDLAAAVLHGDAAAAHLALLGADERAEPPVLLAVRVRGPVAVELEHAHVARVRPPRPLQAQPHHLRRDPRRRELRLRRRRRDRRGRHVEAPLARRVGRVGECVGFVEHHPDVLPLGVPCRIPVVLHVPRGQREDRVVSPHADVLAREPLGAALLVDDVAGDDVGVCLNFYYVS